MEESAPPTNPSSAGGRNQPAPPIRVLHVVDKLSTGGSPVHGLTRLLGWWLPLYDPSRVRASVACLRGSGTQPQLEAAGIAVRYVGRSKYDPRALPELVRTARAEAIDILHLHGFGGSTVGRICGWITGLPCIVHEHVCDVAIPRYQRLADLVLRSRTAAAIAVSSTVADFLVRERHIRPADVHVVYTGVPPALFRVPPSDDRRRSLGIPAGHRVVGTVGRLHAVKGHAHLLRAARRILDAREDVTFLIVGDGELLGDLRRQARQLRLEDHVIFTGHVDDVAPLLAEIDVFVVASVREGAPVTLFEAMAAGCAIVATPVGAVPEVLEDSVSGFIVPPGDAAALAARCIRLLEDRSLRETVGRRAREEALRHDVKKAVRAFERLYDRLRREQP